MASAAQYNLNIESVATVSGTKTMWQLVTGTNTSINIYEFGVGFDSATAGGLMRVDLLYQSTAGTASAGTINQINNAQVATRSSAQITFTAEPTAGIILGTWVINPASGELVIQYPLGREVFTVGTTQRIGLRYVNSSGLTPNYSTYVNWEE